VDIYDTGTGQWSTATLSVARDFLAATTVGTKAIFAGGDDSNSAYGNPTNAVDIYDASTGQWSTATLSQPRTYLAATTVGTRALFAGGLLNGGSSSAVDIYDASTGQWSTATLSQARYRLAATTVGTKALFAGGVGSSAVDIFTLPPTVTVTTASSSRNGTATVGYTLLDSDSHPSSIQVQYSVNGGPWQVATPGPGGDGTSNLASSPLGTAHTFVWNTAHDLGNTNNPSVQVRITPMDAVGTGVTQPSVSFAVDNAGVVNALTIAFNDGNNDTVHLVQNGSTITISGTMAGTATNITSVTVIGGTGRNLLDASGMVMPVTLNGGAGSGPDTLIGGAGSDTFYYSGTGSIYVGGSGANEEIVYPANPGDIIALVGPELVVNGASRNLGSVNHIEYFVVSGSPASVNNGQQRAWPFDDVPLTNVAISSLTAAPGSASIVLTARFTDANPWATTSTVSATINWGDGTTSTGTITSDNPLGLGGNFTITARHVFATNGTRPVVVTILDTRGAAATVGATFTGGLQLVGGNLDLYLGPTPTVLDSGVSSFQVRAADATVFTLHADGSLFAISGSSRQQVDGSVRTILLGPDGKLYDLHADGNLYAGAPGSALAFSDSNVQALLQVTSGTLYKLRADGTLYDLAAGSGWVLARPNVRSVALTADGAALNAVGRDGNYWQYDGSSWTLLAGPHFSLSAPANATAGQAIALTLALLDALNNPVTAYTGTVHFTSSDAAAGLPPDYTFTPTDGGAHTFTITLKTSGSQTITVTAQAASAAASVTVSPAPASFLRVTSVPSTAVAGNAVAFTVTAFDANGNVATGYAGTVHLTSTDGQAVLPADYSFTATDNGTHTFTTTLKTAGGQTVTATDTQDSSVVGSGTVTVTPGSIASLQIIPSVNQATAGTPLAVTVTAVDAYGNIATGFTGTVHFTSSDPLAMLPADYTFTAGDYGTHAFNSVLGTPGFQSLTVSDMANHTGTVSGLRVSPASFLVLDFPASVTAGQVTAFTVTVLDSLGNVATGYYTGTIHFTSSDPRAGLPADYTFTAADAGQHTFQVALYTAGTQSLTATDTADGTYTGTQSGIAVRPAAFSAFRVSGFSSPVVAGTAGSFTVTAQDAYGNTLPDYAGTVTFSSTDPLAVLPADYTFTAADGGVHTFSATLATAGPQALTAVDLAANVRGSQGGILVTPGVVSALVLSGFPSPGGARTLNSFTVTAVDAFGNTVTDYRGTVRFSSDASGVLLPPDYTFTASDAGSHTFDALFLTPGTYYLRVVDAQSGSLTGEQDGIVVL
jgi:hypothetical protein